jgi:hypothetical protein
VLAIGGQGVWASLNAQATNTTPQSVASGSLKLTMAATGVGIEQQVTAIAPGDTVNRHLVLTNTGTLPGGDLTLAVAAPAGSPLVTDAGTTKGLRVTVNACTVAWAPGTGVCSGTRTTAMTQRALSALVDAPATLTLPASATAVGGQSFLQVSLFLPDQDEVTTNGTTVAGSVQARSVGLTYTFATTQRAATTTNS